MKFQKNSKQSGFSLIELLAVIAIIGLLSSIVLINVQSARQKAVISNGLRLSDSMRASIGDSLISYWSFDNGTAVDNWGNNDGTLVNSPTPITGIIDDAFEFDGNNTTGSYIDIGAPADLNLTGASITVEAWVYGESLESFDSVVSKTNSNWNEGYGIYYNSGTIRFFVSHYNQNMASINFSADKWHHIVGTYDGANVKIYLDATEGTSDNYTGNISSNTGDSVFIAAGGNSGYRWNGKIDEVKIYSEALPFSQIQKLYAEGAKRHGIAMSNN